MTTWRCRELLKTFVDRGHDRRDVLTGVDLLLPAGQITCLLGPSGVGKTTLARCIAGLEVPDAGRIECGDQLLNDPAVRVPPHRRQVGMIFQGLALWPHRTVAKHLKVALAGRRVPRSEWRETIRSTLELVGLVNLARRYPARLSGGEQQRLAIARALCNRPQLLIADEPFAGFEETVRAPIRDELRRLTSERELTTLFITHDRAEALALADRLALMRDGRIEQCGPPETLWQEPATAFVARFVAGHQLVPATRRDDGGFETAAGVFEASPATQLAAGLAVFDARTIMANDVTLDGWPATVTACRFDGPGWLVEVKLADGALLDAGSSVRRAVGDAVHLALPRSVRILPIE